MGLILTILRLVHIVAGTFWAGSAFVSAGFLTPAARANGPDGGKFLQYVLGPMHLSRFISLSAILTTLAGLALYGWRLSVGFQLSWFLSPSGLTLAIGAFAGIAAAILGGVITSPAAMQLQALTQAMQSAGGPPRPEQLVKLQAFQQRLSRAGLWGAILLLICVAGMSIARFV